MGGYNNARVLLLDQNGETKEISEIDFDGYYNFSGASFDSYKVMIEVDECLFSPPNNDVELSDKLDYILYDIDLSEDDVNKESCLIKTE